MPKLKTLILVIFLFVFWALPSLAHVDTAWIRRCNGPGNLGKPKITLNKKLSYSKIPTAPDS